jgi:hypothetical protein
MFLVMRGRTSLSPVKQSVSPCVIRPKAKVAGEVATKKTAGRENATLVWLKAFLICWFIYAATSGDKVFHLD